MILNGYENIDRDMFCAIKESKRTRDQEITLVKEQCGYQEIFVVTEDEK